MTVDRAIIIYQLIITLTGMFEPEIYLVYIMECSNFIFGILSIIVHEVPFVVEKQSKAILVDNISNMAHSFY